MTRIEITYSALRPEGERELLSTFFWQTAHEDLTKVQLALREVPDLCWAISLMELFNQFIKSTKGHQLLVVEPTVSALVYAENSKPGCYTGFW